MRGIWGKFPIPYELRIYFFNVTNPDDIANGAKPILQEVGPFIYEWVAFQLFLNHCNFNKFESQWDYLFLFSEWQEKVDQEDNKPEDTVTSSFKRTYIFNPKKSNGTSHNDEVIVPHLFIVGLVNIVKRDKPGSITVVGKGKFSYYLIIK